MKKRKTEFIQVTDYMLDRHIELVKVYERLGREDYARRERMRVGMLEAIRDKDRKVEQQRLSLL